MKRTADNGSLWSPEVSIVANFTYISNFGTFSQPYIPWFTHGWAWRGEQGGPLAPSISEMAFRMRRTFPWRITQACRQALHQRSLYSPVKHGQRACLEPRPQTGFTSRVTHVTLLRFNTRNALSFAPQKTACSWGLHKGWNIWTDRRGSWSSLHFQVRVGKMGN